jgi:hypothetical protein
VTQLRRSDRKIFLESENGRPSLNGGPCGQQQAGDGDVDSELPDFFDPFRMLDGYEMVTGWLGMG